MNEDLIAKLDWDRTIEQDAECYDQEDREMQAGGKKEKDSIDNL